MSFLRKLLGKEDAVPSSQSQPTQPPEKVGTPPSPAHPTRSTEGASFNHISAVPLVGPGTTSIEPFELRMNPGTGWTIESDDHYGRGIAHMTLKQFELAVQEFQETLRLESSHMAARLMLADAYIKLNRNQDAARECNVVLQTEATHPNAHYGLAVVYWRDGQIDQAIREYQAALKGNPRFASAHCYLAVAYRQKGMLSDALREFRMALENDPKHVAAHIEMCNTLYQMDRWQEVSEVAQSLVHLQPDNPFGHYMHGYALFNLGHPVEGVSELRTAAQVGFRPAIQALNELGIA